MSGRPASRGIQLLEGLLAHRRATLLVVLLAVLSLVPGAARIETDNSPEIFFVRGSPEVGAYRRLRDTFGSDKVVRIAVSGSDLWTRSGLESLRRLEQDVARVPGIGRVTGLFDRHAGPGSAWPPDDPAAFRRRVTADPLDRDLGLVDRAGDVVTLLAAVQPESNRKKTLLVGRLEELVGRDLAAGLDGRVAGTPVLDRALDASSREIERRYFPLLVILAVALLAVTFRDAVAVVLPLAFVALAELALVGALGYADVDLNLVLAVLPPLVFVIGLATAVHLLVRLRDVEPSLSGAAAIVEVYRDKGWAVLWTGVTTLVGFGSLATSRVGPVRTLGAWAAIGIAIMTLLAFTLYPVLLTFADRRGRPVGRPLEAPLSRLGRRWAMAAAHHRGAVLAVAGLVAAVAVAGLPRLSIETNAVRYLPRHHPVRADFEALEAKGIGMISVEMVLALPAGRTFWTPDAFGRLAELSDRLRRQDLVLGAVGAGDLLEDAVRRAPGRALFGAATARRVAFDALTGREDGRRALRPWLTGDGRRAHLTVLTRAVGYDRLDPLLGRLRAAAAAVFPRAEVTLTGEYPLVMEAQRRLLATLGESFSLTVVCVTLIFRFLLGSTRLTLLALLPNLWPVLGVVGWMGWADVPLDVATVMVASVILGLAVDDTIHTLGHFRELAPRRGRLEAVAGTLERTAPAYVLTGLILAAGFGVCALSDFAPTSRFGLLSAAGIVLAVVGDLVLVPALLGAVPRAAVAKMAGRTGAGTDGSP